MGPTAPQEDALAPVYFAPQTDPKQAGEKIGEFYWGPLLGSGIESWLAYVIALIFLLLRPQGLFGEKIIERI